MNYTTLQKKADELYQTISHLEARATETLEARSDEWQESEPGQEFPAIIEALQSAQDALAQVTTLA